MVVRREKKIRKRRGRGTGYGSHKKHKGGGSRGGRGLAGLHKHKVMTMIKYMPEHFGKRGFKRPKKVIKEIKAINLKDLDSMVEGLLKQKKAEKTKDGIKVKLSDLGYDKLLGSGKVNHPLIVEARYFSKNAIKKLEESEGKAVILNA
ncbi:MAG: uL15m family ribosomal protein [Candidatus Aenigmarchaeota archaeon]|nr:uL15m family ribosomal protein [Candidatus Aenigmarchaeota archaeon]